MIIVHRVAEIITDESNGQKVIRTKGDANCGSIPGADYPKLSMIGNRILKLSLSKTTLVK